MQRTLRDEMRKLCAQFERLKKGEEPSERLLDTCDLVARVYASLGEDARVEAPKTKDEMLPVSYTHLDVYKRQIRPVLRAGPLPSSFRPKRKRRFCAI